MPPPEKFRQFRRPPGWNGDGRSHAVSNDGALGVIPQASDREALFHALANAHIQRSIIITSLEKITEKLDTLLELILRCDVLQRIDNERRVK